MSGQRLKGGEKVSCAQIWRKSVPGSGNSWCKGPEAGERVSGLSQSTKEASWDGGKGVKRKMEEVRELPGGQVEQGK